MGFSERIDTSLNRTKQINNKETKQKHFHILKTPMRKTAPECLLNILNVFKESWHYKEIIL